MESQTNNGTRRSTERSHKQSKQLRGARLTYHNHLDCLRHCSPRVTGNETVAIKLTKHQRIERSRCALCIVQLAKTIIFGKIYVAVMMNSVCTYVVG